MQCIVCGADQWNTHLDDLKKCENCGFIRADDPYFDIDPEQIYSSQYFNGLDYYNYAMEKPALQANFRNRLKRIRRHKASGELLEIGCAYGYFLALAEAHFSTTGIDLSPDTTVIAKQNAARSKILTQDFLDADFADDSFDVVCMFDVIEHLKHPDAYVEKIHRILKPGGVLVIETGDIGSRLAQFQGRRWRLITPPTHLQYFSKATLGRLLDNYEFSLVESSIVGFARTLNQILYRISRNERVLARLSFIGNRVFTLNTYDLMFMIGQKR